MSNDWEILFSRAVQQLDSANLKKGDWSFGGGTVLTQKFNHRHSKDIDIFFRDPQMLNFVSPRVNDATESNLLKYNETSNFVSLVFDEGEVDFILASQISEVKPTFQSVLGHHIYVDAPVEIVAKKIYYRAEEFKPRDVFDLAIVFDAKRETILKNANAFADKLEILDNRIADLQKHELLEPGLQSLAILPGGEKIRGKELTICQDFIHAVKKQLDRGPKVSRGRSPGRGLSM